MTSRCRPRVLISWEEEGASSRADERGILSPAGERRVGWLSTLTTEEWERL
jgi:hypothetical protein